MSPSRQLHLGAFLRPVSVHAGAWRHPHGLPDGNFNFAHYRRFVQTLERGKFDAIFLADSLARPELPKNALARNASVTSFEPFTLLSALAPLTEHIGLIASASTTYNEPFHVARKFASLDHISAGRAGWNMVTSGNPNEALNFGLSEHVEHAERYDRAREFYEVVTGLWDSWADDAIIADAASGIYFDPDRVHTLAHEGAHFSVKGPLNIARPVQGWPVIVQAGSSEAGRTIAAETAEVVFSAHPTLADSQRFYADVKGRMGKFGRARDSLRILPAAFVVVGQSEAEARAKLAQLDGLVHPDSGLASLSVALGHIDVSGFELDAPLPEIPESNASKSSRQRVLDVARERNLTVRQLCQHLVGSYGSLELVGTASMIADQMEAWLVGEACDGFNVLFPYLPGGIDDFVDQVVPELQRRGLFRRDYEGTTLREHLGLARPKNLFFTD
jgi:FMN-dependent oxidoreductase (nitrilotriacetate monooxygenase family)